MFSRFKSAAGFTLVETLVAIGIFVVATGTAIAYTHSVLPGIRADSQASRLATMMLYGRDLAIANRRNVELRFNVGTNVTQLVLMDTGVERLVQQLDFEYGVTFARFSGMGDTPEAYGDDEDVDFGDSTRIFFEPDGSVIDETGLPTNGTAFLGVEGERQTARAISLTGTTGRPRLYKWHNGAWR